MSTNYTKEQKLEIVKSTMKIFDDAKDVSKTDYSHLKKIKETDLFLICDLIIELLHDSPMLLKLEAPMYVCGDLHGQFRDLMKFLAQWNPPQTKYLFLGDYVDRGPHSIDTITKLFCLKILYPDNIFLLRGNHETGEISAAYGFKDECEEHFSKELWDKYVEAFNYLPLAAVISSRIFCVHGGLSKDLQKLSDISQLRPPLEVPEQGLILDLLWADPSPDKENFVPSERGASYSFGADVAEHFLHENDFDLICRAHQVVPDGFQFPFYPDRSVVTVFSASNYCEEFHNKAAMLRVDNKLVCSFTFVEPEED